MKNMKEESVGSTIPDLKHSLCEKSDEKRYKN
jgi:hypothetical protein